MSTPNPAEVIAEALAKHQHGASVPASLRAECDKHLACTCGEWVSSQCKTMTARDEHRLHQASVIAALPDIAVVSLPAPEQPESWHVTDWDGGRVSLCYGVDTVRCYLPNPALEVGEAERLGIALIAASHSLAAARAVGGES